MPLDTKKSNAFTCNFVCKPIQNAGDFYNGREPRLLQSTARQLGRHDATIHMSTGLLCVHEYGGGQFLLLGLHVRVTKRLQKAHVSQIMLCPQWLSKHIPMHN